MYYAVRNQRSDTDNVVDIMVKLEDASRMNRIIERFGLTDTSQSAPVSYTHLQNEKCIRNITD